jgi:saccharopine dehydrogenase (NAD+, L-lysine forming)
MSKVTVLGGVGAVGSVAVKTLVACGEFAEVVIADINLEKAQRLAGMLGGRGVSAAQCDASDPASIRQAIQGSDVVLNCVGPFYATVKTVLSEVIRAGIDYVDVCDDVDVTIDILDMQAEAERAGITALIGMGSSPGLTNVVARFAADSLLEEVESIDIFHTHGGEPIEGEGVIGHRFHCMSIPIPMYLEGHLQYVKYFEPEGIALRQRFEFPLIGETLLYPYPHPEQITLPRYIKLQRVTNKGSVLPEAYYNLTRDLCQLGLSSQEPLSVKGQMVTPHDFTIAFIIRERERILKETGFGRQRGCISVLARGRQRGEPVEYRFHMVSTSQALGEGTGIPAAIGTMLMARGQVQGKGVFPPEACLAPRQFLDVAVAMMTQVTGAAPGAAAEGLIVERVNAQGDKQRVAL